MGVGRWGGAGRKLSIGPCGGQGMLRAAPTWGGGGLPLGASGILRAEA